MTNILILEDDNISLQTLKKMVENVSKEIQITAVSTLQDAEKVINQTSVMFHAFFLDINLQLKNADDISGLQFAKEIRSRKQYAFTPIVMITSLANLELKAYRELHCYQYIIKPYEETEITALVKKLLFQTGEMTEVSLTVKINGINYKIFSKDIIYMKAITRGVSLTLAKEEIRVPYTSIKQMLEKLPADQFVQCHRMYVVNQDYIDYVDYVNSMIKLVNGEEVEIGVTYKNDIRRKLNG